MYKKIPFFPKPSWAFQLISIESHRFLRGPPVAVYDLMGVASIQTQNCLQDDAAAVAMQDIAILGTGGSRDAPIMGRISEEPLLRASLESASGSYAPPLGAVIQAPRAVSGVGKQAVEPSTVFNLLGKSATAQTVERPKGLGQAQGLPTKKRSSSAKSSMQNVRSVEGQIEVGIVTYVQALRWLVTGELFSFGL